MYLQKTKAIKTKPECKNAVTGTLRWELGVAQTIGKRQEQQDAFIMRRFLPEDGLLLALSDGMGGLQDGAAAAVNALEAFSGYLEKHLSSSTEEEEISLLMENAVGAAQSAVCDLCRRNHSAAGATIAAVLIFREKFYFSSVGDSRIYLCRNGTQFQVNEDHSLENYLFRFTLREEEAPELSGSIYSYLGQESLAEIDYSRRGFSLEDKDLIFLCTDGFYNAMEEEEYSLQMSGKSVQKQTEALLKKVLKKKKVHQDNTTIVAALCRKDKKEEFIL